MAWKYLPRPLYLPFLIRSIFPVTDLQSAEATGVICTGPSAGVGGKGGRRVNRCLLTSGSVRVCPVPDQPHAETAAFSCNEAEKPKSLSLMSWVLVMSCWPPALSPLPSRTGFGRNQPAEPRGEVYFLLTPRGPRAPSTDQSLVGLLLY